ncbi:MAG: hypothetical protein ABJU46_03680 [Paracoccaceae bacterium]
MTVTLAFYKGRGSSVYQRLQDGIIRSVTRGIYSHVELISGDALLGQPAVCLSASGRDGGVRHKRIVLKPESWDLVSMPVDADGPCQFIEDQLGAPYDYAGIVLSQVFAFGRHNPDKWFCSEIIAASLDIPTPQRISPQFLFDVVMWGQRN